MRSSKTLPSVHTELLLSLGLLAAAAILVAVVIVVGLYPLLAEAATGVVWLTVLVAADVGVLVVFVAGQVKYLVRAPLDRTVSAVEAIANGDLARRVPTGASNEFDMLARSINRMTDALLAEQAQRMRVEKLASVGRLAAGIAHEIGNPLGGINGYVHLLRRSGATHPEAADAITGVEREAGRIDRIVRGLLDYARPRRRTPASVDVNRVVESVLELLRLQGALRGVAVEPVLDESRPAILAERNDIEQVLVNLLLNALDAMGDEGRIGIRTRRVRRDALLTGAARRGDDPSVVVIAREPDAKLRAWIEHAGTADELVQVVVADSGPGVSDENAERIFDPFFTTKEPGKGTGLGLAIVSQVVEGLGGAIWVQAAREGGAAFVMLFPLASSQCGTPGAGHAVGSPAVVARQ